MSKKFNLIQAIEFTPYSQEDIEALIRADLEKDLPAGVEINDVQFITKRSPTRIEAEIAGGFIGERKVTAIAVPETEVATEAKASVVAKAAKEAEPDEEEAEEEATEPENAKVSEAKAPQTVGDIFGDD